MTLTEYMIKAFDIGILKDDTSGKWYIDPWWEVNMISSGYRYSDFLSVDTWKIIQAECNRRNLQTSKTEMICDWLWKFIDSSADPAITKATNGLTEDIVSYLKEKYNLDKSKSTVSINFSKKEDSDI